MRLPRGLGFLGLAIAWTAAMLVVGVLVYEARLATEAQASRAMTLLALAIGQHTSRSFNAIGIALEQIAEQLLVAPVRENDPKTQRMLESRMRAIPSTRAIFVVGRDGFITHDTDHPKTPRRNLADRSYFRAFEADPSLRVEVSEPLISRTEGLGLFVAVAWPLRRHGAFDGVVVAAVRPAYYQAIYREMGLRASETIALHHRNGVVVARYPPDSSLPLEPAPRALKFTAAGQGAYRVGAGTHARLVAFYAIEDLPFVVSVEQSLSDVLAAWRRSAWGAALAMGGLTALLLLFLARLERDRKRRNAARQRLAQTEKLQAMGELTGGLAHDFGNLLQVVAVNAAALRQSAPGWQPHEQALDAIDRAIGSGAAQIRRLLAFARQQPLRLEAVELNALLGSMHGLLAQAAGPRIELVYETSPDLPPVRADAGQIEAALLNLVANARDAQDGTGRIVIRTFVCTAELATARGWAAQYPGHVCLAAQDEGAGMSEEVRRRAVEPFFTTKGDSGTGLGLAQIYGFMQQVGGDVQIDSAPGRGTTVTLLFPAAYQERTKS